MKTLKKAFIGIAMLIISASAIAQLPETFNYQAILRENSGTAIPDEPVTVRFQLVAIQSGDLLWQEDHSLTTNAFGLINLIIGTGTKTGGLLGSFGDIDWLDDDHSLQVSVYYGSSWHDFPANQLQAVPYAMTAERSLDNPFGMSGDTVTLIDGSLSIGAPNPGRSKVAIISQDDLSEDALFEVKRSDGQTIFAVYNEGVRIYLPTDPLTKGPKGGFAIGGFDRTKGDYTEDYMWVTPDSIRMYIDKTPDGKGPKGGFAIGGFDRTKGTAENFLDLTPENYFIGHKSGSSNFSGQYNSFVGYETGLANYSGSSNALFGFQAGYNNYDGSNNLFLGYQSGFSNTTGSYNSFMGYRAGYLNTIGGQNSFLGSFTGANNIDGDNNTFSGYNSGYSNQSGSSNNFYGTSSGFSNTTGSNNVFIGPESGFLNSTGSYNTFVGYRAGYSNSANNNVFIGHDCGYSNTTGNVNVFIGYAAGRNNIGGSGNVFLGNGAGHYNDYGDSNVFMGERSGFNNTSGGHNVFIGFLTGFTSTAAFGNVSIGYQSGNQLTIAQNNVFVGTNTGRLTTWGGSNVFIGTNAGESNITGGSNVIIGQGAGEDSNASDNVFVGYASGLETTGNGNVFLGNQTGYNNDAGANNVFIGNGSGYANSTGNNNVFIGYQTGRNETGSNKLYIDNSNTTAPLIYGDFSSNYLTINGNLTAADTYFRIANDPGTGTTPISYAYQGFTGSSTKSGAFAVRDGLWVTGPSWYDSYMNVGSSLSVGTYANVGSSMTVGTYLNINNTGPVLMINGDEAIWYNGTYFSWGYEAAYNYFARRMTIGHSVGNASYMLYVNGSAGGTTGWANLSDRQFKKDIESIKDPVDKVLKMNGVSYLWKTDEYSEKNFPDGRHYGVIAQEIETVLPEVVNESDEGEKSVSYTEIIPVLIEAIKEQQGTIEKQDLENSEMQEKIQALQDQINELRAHLTANSGK